MRHAAIGLITAVWPFARRCTTCGLLYTHCPGHFGHIELAVPVYNPLVFGCALQPPGGQLDTAFHPHDFTALHFKTACSCAHRRALAPPFWLACEQLGFFHLSSARCAQSWPRRELVLTSGIELTMKWKESTSCSVHQPVALHGA